MGTHQGRPLYFDFYGDSLLVVDDFRITNFDYDWNSLRVFGDTTFQVRYEFVLDRLIITTESGVVVTMAPQSIQARPLRPRLAQGPVVWTAETSNGQLQIRLSRGGAAAWRQLPGGRWITGRWNRSSNNVVFRWPNPNATEPADSLSWFGQYDNPRAIIVSNPTRDIDLAIFRRRVR